MNEQSLKDRMRKIRLEKNMSAKECLNKLFLERFLARLSRSSQSDNFIFKGGFLLSYILPIGRETSDLDFLVTRIKANEAEIQKAIEEIISEPSEDGFTFLFKKIELLDQPHMKYLGYRITLQISLGNIRDNIKIDVGIGDVVDPKNQRLSLIQCQGKSLFEDEISVLAYPTETIFAEKLETIIAKGAGNSRMKDYHDLIKILRSENIINITSLNQSAHKTFKHRRTLLSLIYFDELGLENLQRFWSAHIGNLGNADHLKLPLQIIEVIFEINVYILKIKLISLGTIPAEMKGSALLEQIKTALAAGADVNDNSRNGHRPLQMLLKKGETKAAQLLIEHDADPNYCDRSGQTPIQAAINHGRSQFGNANRLIKKGAKFSPNVSNNYDYTKFYDFIQFGRK